MNQVFVSDSLFSLFLTGEKNLTAKSMVATRNQSWESRIHKKIEELRIRYFGYQPLHLPIPILVLPTYHRMSYEDVMEAGDDYYQMTRFHYLLTSEAERRNGFYLLAEEAVVTEDKAAGIRLRESRQYLASEWELVMGYYGEKRAAKSSMCMMANGNDRFDMRSKPSIPTSKFIVSFSFEETSLSWRGNECSVMEETVNSVEVLGKLGIRKDKRVDSAVPKVQRAQEKRAMAEGKVHLAVDDVLSLPPPISQTTKLNTKRNNDEASVGIAAAQDEGEAGRVHRVSSYPDFVRLTREQLEATTLGSMSTMYQSLENLEEGYFEKEITLALLLRPRNPYGHRCRDLKLNMDDTEETTLRVAGGRANGVIMKKTRTHDRAVRAIPAPKANAELQVNLNADINGWIEVFTKNKSTKKELVDLSSRHGYGEYALVVIVQMRSTANGYRVMTDSPCYSQYKDVEIKVGDKIKTVQFFHSYKRGVDRVFMDQPIFLEKVALEAPRVLSLNSNKYFSELYGDDVVFIANDWQTTLLPYYIKSINKFQGIYESANVYFLFKLLYISDHMEPLYYVSINILTVEFIRSYIQNLLKIVSGLGQVRGGWSNALSVVKWIYNRNEYKLKKNRFVYTKLLAVPGKARMPSEALRIFMEFEDQSIRVKELEAELKLEKEKRAEEVKAAVELAKKHSDLVEHDDVISKSVEALKVERDHFIQSYYDFGLTPSDVELGWVGRYKEIVLPSEVPEEVMADAGVSLENTLELPPERVEPVRVAENTLDPPPKRIDPGLPVGQTLAPPYEEIERLRKTNFELERSLSRVRDYVARIQQEEGKNMKDLQFQVKVLEVEIADTRTRASKYEVLWLVADVVIKKMEEARNKQNKNINAIWNRVVTLEHTIQVLKLNTLEHLKENAKLHDVNTKLDVDLLQVEIRLDERREEWENREVEIDVSISLIYHMDKFMTVLESRNSDVLDEKRRVEKCCDHLEASLNEAQCKLSELILSKQVKTEAGDVYERDMIAVISFFASEFKRLEVESKLVYDGLAGKSAQCDMEVIRSAHRGPMIAKIEVLK
ncbi:hypothetical protein GIB67_038580 [Kingdonia uniflora]|uniref:Starch synthase catalytic domain-containing protein n=1 Tax=Kingdonia uniflora TaxID=39325 RepID=A0A7J7NPP3_9MAGN|nr:hypothetical protein GIB67_038580 [Kingdonia uniflora]